MKKNSIFAIVSVFLLIGLDQLVKFLITSHKSLSDTIPVIKNVFHITYIQNRGAAWGSLQGKRILLLAVTLLVLIFLVYFYIKMLKMDKYKDLRILFLFVFSGAVGNMIDRIRLGYVIHLPGSVHFRHVRQNFPCRPAVHVPRHDTTCKSKCFHRPDRRYHLPPPECASRRGKQHQRQGNNGYRRCGTILFLRNRHPHGQLHKGRTGQCVARKHRSRRAASHGCHSHGDRRRDGQLPCHPQDRGGGERHGQHILQRTSAHRLQDTLGKRPH